MNAIIGYIQLVREHAKQELPTRQYDNLGKSLISAEHLVVLINDMLDHTAHQVVHPTAFALPPLVDLCLRAVEPRLRDGVGLAADIDPDLPDITTDRDKLRRILDNLLSNAVEFTDQGSVTVAAHSDGGGIVISVIDTGTGIADEQREAVFEEFHQIHGERPRQMPGTGLGLTISRELVRLLGGELEIESKIGEGSTFSITIPMLSTAKPGRQQTRHRQRVEDDRTSERRESQKAFDYRRRDVQSRSVGADSRGHVSSRIRRRRG